MGMKTIVVTVFALTLAMLPIAGCGDAGQPTVQQLIVQLADPEMRVRRSAAIRLAEIGPQAAAAVDALIPCLEDVSPTVRYRSTRALRAIGPAATAATPTLMRLLLVPGDRHPPAPELAQALVTIGGPSPEILSTLRESLANKHLSPDAFCRAAQELGEAAQPLLPELRRLFDGRESWVAGHAMMAMGPAAADAVPDFVRAITTSTGSVDPSAEDWDTFKVVAIAALREIGPLASEAIPALEREAASGNGEARLALEHIRGEVR